MKKFIWLQIEPEEARTNHNIIESFGLQLSGGKIITTPARNEGCEVWCQKCNQLYREC